jgi:hypothetical protein
MVSEEFVAADPIELSCEYLDRAVGIEMRPQGLPGGIVPKLYEIARGQGKPISLQAAEGLLREDVRRVACMGGIVWSPLPRGEVDGPIGAAVLAEGMRRLGRESDVVVPAEMVGVVQGVRTAIGGTFGIRDEREIATSDYDAAVTVEKGGRNRKGVAHSIFGKPRDRHEHKVDDFIEALGKEGKITIGIGDGGNEIGFGAIFERAREVVPRGVDCTCPCHDGIVTSTATQIVYPVAVSNFGAYAITAALGILSRQPLLLVSPEAIAGAIEAAVARGCVDGGSYEPGRLGDDGVPLSGVLGVVAILRTIACQQFAVSPRHA